MELEGMNLAVEVRRFEKKADEALRKIGYIARPIAIVLFGAESDLKKQVQEAIVTKISHISSIVKYDDTNTDLGWLRSTLEERENVLIVISSIISRDNLARSKLTTKLKQLGARDVIGIATISLLARPINKIDDETNFIMQNYPPEIDNMDELLTITQN